MSLLAMLCLWGVEPIDLFAAGMTVSEVVAAGVINLEFHKRLALHAMRTALSPGLIDPCTRRNELIEARLA